MSKAKVVLLGVLAALAVNAAMAGTASANSSHIYLIEQTPLTSGSEAIEGQSQNSQVETVSAKTLLVVECQEDVTSSGAIKPSGESEFKIEFKNCFAFTKIAKTGAKEFLTACTVVEPVKVEGKDNLIEHSVDEFANLVGTLTLEGGSCVLAGAYTVEGKQLCATPESEFEKVIHHLICTPAGSALKLKKEPAQFFGEEQIKLKSGLKWAGT